MDFKEWLNAKGLTFEEFTELPFYKKLAIGEEFYAKIARWLERTK